MKRLSSTIGKLQTDLKGLSHFIENATNVAGNISFNISEACTLRIYLELLQDDIDILKDIDAELEKIQNYNKSAETFNEPEDREINGKTPSTPEKSEPNKETTGNMVNHPLHYQANEINGTHLECIDVMEAVKGWFPTAIFCELNAFKYNWRVGQKDFTPTELAKIRWYSDKACELWKTNLKWFYPKNQHIYAIIGEVKQKNPTTGEWSDAVLYTDGKGKYVRDKSDFINKFKKA